MNHLRLCCCVVLLVVASGCITHTPRPHRFVDTNSVPAVFTYCSAWSDGSKLILDVTPEYSPPSFYGIEAFREGNDFYVYPSFENIIPMAFNISSMGSTLNPTWEAVGTGPRTNRAYRFTIDTGKYGMQDDWPSHTYWLRETGTYWFPGRRFWSESKRDPAVRSRIEVHPISSSRVDVGEK